MIAPRVTTAGLLVALLGAAASAQAGSNLSAASPSPAVSSYALGNFPEFPAGPLPERTEAALQAVVDEAVEQGEFDGVTASVISADRGSWSGVAGSWDGVPASLESRYPTHSAAKTIVAAQIFRLAEGGSLALDDLASTHLPPALSFYDANGATVRQVLGMRSGIPDWNEDSQLLYPAEQAATALEVFQRLPKSQVPPGAELHYASTNYVLLGAIIEQLTGQTMAEALRSDVLAHPGLEGLVYTVGDPLGADGWGVETTSASLARWGWALYGGSVISEASLREMTDFGGEWYGLGSSDYSFDLGTPALGHGGVSSPTTCCSIIALVALPEEAMVIAVQARTPGTSISGDSLDDVTRLTRSLRSAAQ